VPYGVDRDDARLELEQVGVVGVDRGAPWRAPKVSTHVKFASIPPLGRLIGLSILK